MFLLAAGMAGCSSINDDSMPDLRETYRYRDTRPFGGYMAYHLLQNSYPDLNVQVKTNAFATTAAWISDTNSVYVSLSKNFFTDEEDDNALLDYVYKGNIAFISAAEIDTAFLNKLYCGQDSLRMLFEMVASYQTTKVSLVPAVVTGSDSMKQYYFRPFTNYFSRINDRYCRIVGYNNFQQPNFITFFWGKGRFYLHCEPRALSNYFLLQKDNYRYLEQVMQTFPENPEHVYWDDYYNKVSFQSSRAGGNGNNTGSFWNAVFKNPPLRTAFWIILALLVLYILVNFKRRQRIIPIIKPVQNSSVAYAEAIGGLYLKEKNNKTIAEKMINYFNESVRTRYFLNTNVVDKDFINTLSKKSGVPFNTTETLYRTIQQVANMEQTSDLLLLDLNNQIQQFNKYNS
ncbi:hypothetical protein EGI32_16155 [Ferruginibacter sp. HRS2-29]|nr:hypothetical protein [Ferruginibacter sp. HRS2-29]